MSAPAPFWQFRPMLAGATLRERLVGCVGALVGIAFTGLLSGFVLGFGRELPLLIAPMGASAVLLFAVPASPLAQPWSILGGNVLSAVCGWLVAQTVPDPAVAAGAAVALAILVMSLTRSLHPPGGAVALTAVLGGPAVAKWGVLFPLVPVGLNSALLLALGLLFHRLTWRRYPHRPEPAPSNAHGTADPPAPARVGFRDEDVDAALEALHETLDVDRDDLGHILREIERRALAREHRTLTCAEIMSRDIIAIREEAGSDDARALLLAHNIRTLPVLDAAGHLRGTVGLRDLSGPSTTLAGCAVPARTAAPDAPAVALLPALTDGSTHAVIVTADGHTVLGLISQTDLLSALGRLLLVGPVVSGPE